MTTSKQSWHTEYLSTEHVLHSYVGLGTSTLSTTIMFDVRTSLYRTNAECTDISTAASANVVRGTIEWLYMCIAHWRKYLSHSLSEFSSFELWHLRRLEMANRVAESSIPWRVSFHFSSSATSCHTEQQISNYYFLVFISVVVSTTNHLWTKKNQN